jgi:endonuclease YncB( thermonuclease family)
MPRRPTQIRAKALSRRRQASRFRASSDTWGMATAFVGRTADPNKWIEVRLADFNAPELRSPGGPAAKAVLEGLVLQREVVCTSECGRSGHVRSFDRVIARCRIGASLGDLLRQAGIAEGGN